MIEKMGVNIYYWRSFLEKTFKKMDCDNFEPWTPFPPFERQPLFSKEAPPPPPYPFRNRTAFDII